MEPFVRGEEKEGVYEITFFHPKGNSLTKELLTKLADQISHPPASCRIIILQSEGESSFCGGASFDELVTLKDLKEAESFFMGFGKVILSILNSTKPVIGIITGKVVGGGVGVVAACDVALAVPSALVRLSEIAIGIGPFVVGPIIQDKIGLQPFQYLSLSTEWADPTWSLEHGLFTSLSKDSRDLENQRKFWVGKFKSYSEKAFATFKSEMRKQYTSTEPFLKERAKLSGALVLSSEAQSILAALLKKP